MTRYKTMMNSTPARAPVAVGGSWIALITFTGWVVLLLGGVVGFALPYARPQTPPVDDALPPVELLEVELGEASETPPQSSPTPVNDPEPPPLLEPVAPPDAPPMIEVAEMSDAVAFALPVEAPARVVEASRASYATPAVEQPVATAAPTVQALTFGAGEGRQPAPEYPWRARREGQEGTVGVVFAVGPDGRVTAAEISRSSPWPLLNTEALRVIRREWRFPRGEARRYDVNIRFELSR